MSQQLDALREFTRIPILSSLSDQEIFDFIRACRVRTLAPGETLFSEGDAGRSMFIIGEGAIEVFVQRQGGQERVATLGAREVIGELSLLDPAPRSATARVTEKSTVYEVMADDFDQLLAQDHPAAFKIARTAARVVCRRIRAVNTRIEEELSASQPRRQTSATRSATADYPSVPEVRSMTGSPRAVQGAEPSVTSPRPMRSTASVAPVRGEAHVSRSVTGSEPAVGKPSSPTGAIRSLISRFWKDET